MKDPCHLFLPSIGIVFLLLASWACNRGDRHTDRSTGEITEKEMDTTGLLLKYNANLFSIPSPYQAAYFIKKHDVSFSQDYLHDPGHHARYNTSFKQALNMGVYATDMGYLHIFNKDKELHGYFKALKKMTGELGLDDALSGNEMETMRRNLTGRDSLIFHLSHIYRKFNAYLKESGRRKTGALIIAGGWIESNYLLSQIVLQTQERSLLNRLGEQKYVLDHLIDLLSSYYYDSERYTQLVDALVDIAYEYDGVIYNYYYKEPLVKEDEKLTIIRSSSNVVISQYHLRTISNKLRNLRNKIVS